MKQPQTCPAEQEVLGSNRHLVLALAGELGEQIRLSIDQRLALLRCVEALRLHAFDHDGKLPAKLAEVRLPLPVDPVTGQPFAYELKGSTAILRGTPPAGKEKDAAYNIRYEVTIR